MRVDRFEEAVSVVTGLLETDAPFSFDGKHYQVKDSAPQAASGTRTAAHRSRSAVAENACSG